MPSSLKPLQLLGRLRQASREEVLFRGRQLVWNRYEALRSRPGLRSRVEANTLSDQDSAFAPGRFFFSSSELPALVRTLRERLPEAMKETIDRADRVSAHRFDLLGYRDLDLGRRLDWHWDPVHQKRAPRVLFYRVPYLDFETVGDSKVIWELNRHQHFITLGKAYQLTGKAEYLHEFSRQFYDWREQNPYLVGINWASSLEVAFRSLSWIWASVLFSTSRAFSLRFQQDLLLALGRNARFIEHNLSTYFSPNTHLLGEALALFFIGTLCPQLRRAPVWKELGWKIMQEESERQVRADGGHFEQATYYHTYALDMFLHARILAARNRMAIPERFDGKIQDMLDYLAALSASGPVPRFGDDDGGRLFAPERNEHLSDPLSTGAVLFRRGDWKAAARGLVEETIWLLGPAGAAGYDALSTSSASQVVAPGLSPAPATLKAGATPGGSQAFPASGIYVMAKDDSRLVMRAGPFGAGHCGHAHADALSLDVSAAGRTRMADGGTYTYTGSEKWRAAFRGTAAHNTVRIDGCDQAVPAAPFKWEGIPQTRIEHWHSGERFDLLLASHNGYERLPSPATHRRLVFFVKPRFWIVVDAVEGTGHHKLEIFWNFPVKTGARTLAALDAATRSGGFGLVPLADPHWSRDVLDTWHSPVYGRKEPATTLRCGIETTLPADYATLLLPRAAASGRLLRLPGDGAAGIRAYRYTVGPERHSVVWASGSGEWQAEGLASDARFAYCQQDAGGQGFHAFVWHGSFLSVGGTKVFENPSRVEHWENGWQSSVGAPLGGALIGQAEGLL